MDEIQVGFASWDSRETLSRLWSEVFGDSKETLNFFFHTLFRPTDTLICTVNGQIASALYLLPAYFLCDGVPEKAHYIYAAATFPCFRSRGYMNRLLTEAEIQGTKRGDHYSFLLPSQDSLYGFYAGKGYRDFFQERVCVWNGSSVEKQSGLMNASLEQIVFLRDRAPLRDGSVLWGSKHIALAMHFFAVYGGSVLTDGAAYAFCEKPKQGNCVVRELLAETEEQALQFARMLLYYFPSHTYTFHFPPDWFVDQGTLQRHGMLKPLSGKIPNAAGAYLGLALE